MYKRNMCVYAYRYVYIHIYVYMYALLFKCIYIYTYMGGSLITTHAAAGDLIFVQPCGSTPRIKTSPRSPTISCFSLYKVG